MELFKFGRYKNRISMIPDLDGFSIAIDINIKS